ncbi:GGDEF domain-containing protein [Oceanimonas sp. NS1]|nr:GGDEF domain-containing protein [Oceanimonas sp. NS1]
MTNSFFPRTPPCACAESDRRVLGGELSTEEVEIVGKDGHSTVFLDIKAPIFDDPEQQDVVGLLGIRTDITPLKNSEQQLRQLAQFDPLTKLHNRLMLSDRLYQAMSQARRHGQSLAVVYLDLDGFKHINDSHGHATGDKVLATTARRMKDAVREGDTLARVGGDEFVAILLDLPGEECAPLLERLLEATARPVTVGHLRLRVTASLGSLFTPRPKIWRRTSYCARPIRPCIRPCIRPSWREKAATTCSTPSRTGTCAAIMKAWSAFAPPCSGENSCFITSPRSTCAPAKCSEPRP